VREKAILFALLLVLPALAGCTSQDFGFNQPKRWNLTLPLGVLVSPRAGAAAEDVVATAELAARQIQTSDLGATITIRQDAAADSASLAYDRLVGAGVAAVIAAVAPDEAAALAERAATKKVPLLLVTPADPAARNVAAFVQLAAPSAALGNALAAQLTAPSATVFALQDPFTTDVEEAFDAAYNGTFTIVNLTRGQQGAAIAAARGACASGAGGALLLLLAQEAGWVVRGLQEGGCRGRTQVVAAPSARSGEIVTAAGRDPANNNAYAAGVIGVEPQGARLAEFRTFFATEYDRDQGRFAAEAYDAVVVAALAAFDAKGAPGAKPVRATITAGDLSPRLVQIVKAPARSTASSRPRSTPRRTATTSSGPATRTTTRSRPRTSPRPPRGAPGA
jgi:hypothetical protein